MSLTTLKGTYAIDPAHSRIGFSARHAMVTKVRGTFNEFEGVANLDGQNPDASKVDVTINADSFDSGNEMRDGHVRTGDFLDTGKFPQITFKTTAVHVTGDDTFDLTGDLTIKETTKPITIPFEFLGSATDPFGNERIGFEGETVINRKDWGVEWNAPLEAGGVLVSEKVTLDFEVSAIKQA